MYTHSTKRRVATKLALYFLTGLALAWLIGWGCAALRPNDGYANVLGTRPDKFGTKYLMPQHRLRTADGDVFVDVVATPFSTTVTLSPLWSRRMEPEDEWLLTNYAYPENVHPSSVALWPDRSKWIVPAWATRPNANSTELNIHSNAWGWPFRCLMGTEHVHAIYAPDGSFTGPRQSCYGYWSTSHGAAASKIRRLPLIPIPAGLLLNAFLYGAAIWSLAELTSTLRRALRRRRGLCPACAYDLRATPAGSPCPECGAHPATR